MGQLGQLPKLSSPYEWYSGKHYGCFPTRVNIIFISQVLLLFSYYFVVFAIPDALMIWHYNTLGTIILYNLMLCYVIYCFSILDVTLFVNLLFCYLCVYF